MYCMIGTLDDKTKIDKFYFVSYKISEQAFTIYVETEARICRATMHCDVMLQDFKKICTFSDIAIKQDYELILKNLLFFVQSKWNCSKCIIQNNNDNAQLIDACIQTGFSAHGEHEFACTPRRHTA